VAAAAFALGLNAEHVFSWSAQLVSALIHAPAVLRQAAVLFHH
jgi:hypothetical protein